MIGKNLGGRYELLELIGEGGMAVVYKAHCTTLDRIVAVKILKDEFSQDINFVERFRTEALAAAQLTHANIVNIFDVGQDGDIHYIVMEYVEGMNLKQLIQAEAPFPVSQAVNVAVMILDGLHQAHEKGIIHRDVKPQNIIITNDGTAKVADFGIAKATTKKTITFGGNIIGSVHYIAPEQAKGEPVNRSTDLYAVACIMYELLTGQVPFEAESTVTVALKHIHEEPVRPREINSRIPEELERIIMKGMNKDPNRRYLSAQEMRTAIVDFYKNVDTSAGRLFTTGEKLDLPSLHAENSNSDKPKKRKIRIKSTRVITAVLAILGVLSGFLYSSGGLFGKEIEVPEVRGKLTKEANEILTAESLKMKVISEQYSNEVEADHVITQNPVPGSKVKAGREVGVVLSSGAEQTKVPSVIGLMKNDAEATLTKEGLTVGDITPIYNDRYPENTIVYQKPGANEMVPVGSSVILQVSSGKAPNKVKVPNLLNSTLDSAKRLLENSNLELGEVKNMESTQYAFGRVARQSIAADVQVDEHSKIDITLSTGSGSNSGPDTNDIGTGTGPATDTNNSGTGTGTATDTNNAGAHQTTETAKTKSLEFVLPVESQNYQVQIKVKDAQGERIVYNQQHRGGDQITVAVNYYQSGTAEVLLNGISYKTFQL